MKKYISPISKVAEIPEEYIIATSDPENTYGFEEGDGLAKKREPVDFTDDESIW